MTDVRHVELRTHPSALRRGLLAILVFGIAGTWAELLLLDHTEGWQLVPVCLLIAGLLVLAWHGIQPRATAFRAVQATMILFVVSGFIGLGQHFTGNVEFERELHPGAGRASIVWGALKGATPALAPGTMIQLGLVGLLYAHLAYGDRRRDHTSIEDGKGLR